MGRIRAREVPQCQLYVCTSCREKGSPREPEEQIVPATGSAKHCKYPQRLATQQSGRGRPTPCLSICPRPCGIALSLNGSWVYLFGDQVLQETTEDILRCVSLYLQSPDGFMPRDERPPYIRRSILGRVPPLLREDSCI